MKIEFVKETKIDGKVMYFTQVNGNYISDSLSYDIDKAKLIYDNIIENKGKINFKEVLESVEIEVAQ
jgi:uncharacterized membrane protein